MDGIQTNIPRLGKSRGCSTTHLGSIYATSTHLRSILFERVYLDQCSHDEDDDRHCWRHSGLRWRHQGRLLNLDHPGTNTAKLFCSDPRLHKLKLILFKFVTLSFSFILCWLQAHSIRYQKYRAVVVPSGGSARLLGTSTIRVRILKKSAVFTMERAQGCQISSTKYLASILDDGGIGWGTNGFAVLVPERQKWVFFLRRRRRQVHLDVLN